MTTGEGKTRVLIVEDEAPMALSLEEGLAELGYAIAGTAAFGEEAVSLCDEYTPDVILMDIKLRKGIDGIEAARIINSRHDIPVIFTTAYSDESDLQRAKGTSPYGYVLKPFNFREIRIAIDLAVSKHEAEKRLERERTIYQRRLQALAIEISRVEDRERNKLAEYIHDHITQKIALAKIQLSESLKGGCLHPETEHSIRLLEEALAETRSMIFDLSPAALFELGLRDTLEWLAGELKRKHGLDVSTERIEDASFNRETMHFIFRSARELLMNASKHSGVSAARVSTETSNGTFRLTVEDSGRGFVQSEDTEGMSFGLFSIQEAARMLEGDLRVESSPARGTKCVVSIPAQGKESRKNGA